MESKRLTGKTVKFLLMITLVLMANFSMAQSEKQIEKAVKVFLNKGYSDGINLLVKYIYKAAATDEGSSYEAYEMWVKMEHMRYVQYDELEIEIGTTDSGEPDSTLFLLFEGLKVYQEEAFLDVCRKSTLESSSLSGEIYLRNFLVDFDPDTLVSEKAKSYFTEAEEFYGKEDYELAELNYRKALNEDSSYYKALLYLGDTFWAREDYDSAIVYFTMAKNLHPDLLEPRNYIIDALMEKGLYYRAKKECLDAFTVYPGVDVKFRLYRILEVENKILNEHRFIRYFYPNNMKVEDQPELSGIFDAYRKAKHKVSKYCNEDGIIEPNGLTSERYLEVYSFRHMFEEYESELPPALEFGYKAMEDGYLDCYVFISLFHVDIYPQFKDFMSFEENRVRAVEYIEKYLVEAGTQTN